MQDFKVTSHRRAELYHWFTALFAAPLAEDEIQEFDGHDMHAFLTSLATLDPMKEAAEAFRIQAGRVLQQPQPHAGLNRQYQQLFGRSPSLLDSSRLAQADDEALILMSVLLKQHGTRLPDDDPLNLCNQLEMMATLAMASCQAGQESARQALLDQQRELANQLLIGWLPVFVEACHQRDSTGFYSAAADLLQAMFSMDLHYLNNVAE
ncbi:molecular chaperone TorD family protein [Zobellella maritima]|uniref:molecular chaperone TorD family protein n=1 Tax=Zobellella maritima TaxID=2059725 RepID=UPI000E302E1E|nr:molecular chaperone TorD family protein [Zobellella maritima]